MTAVADHADLEGDTAWGAFTAEGPWRVTPARTTWFQRAEYLRAAAGDEVPVLTTPRRLPPGLRILTVSGRLCTALGQWYLRRKLGRFPTPEASRLELSQRLRRAAEALGSTYIKLGQIISSG